MVRAVVLGDPQTGKSSIINCFISNSFEEDVAPVIPVAVLPPEASPEGQPLTLVDTSSRSSDAATLTKELVKADVAIVVYAADRPETLANVSSHWLPMIIKTNSKIPVVVVGNKVDLRSGDAHRIESDLRNAAASIMDGCKEVETCLECSAKKMINIAEVHSPFNSAHAPNDMRSVPKHFVQKHRPGHTTWFLKFCSAPRGSLTKILNIGRANEQDKLLSDAELSAFQEVCFKTPLLPRQLRGIKDVVRRNVQDGVSDNGRVTLSGFLYLHTLFIQRGSAETTWVVLRAFGYGRDLRLDRARLPKLGSRRADQALELTEAGLYFVRKAFWEADVDGDGMLSPAEMDAFFQQAPSPPWAGAPAVLVRAGAPRGVGLDGFLAAWAACALRDPEGVQEALVYLGYEGGREAACASALRVTQRQSMDFGRVPHGSMQTVFKVLVCASSGASASTVAASLIQHGADGIFRAGRPPAEGGEIAPLDGELVAGQIQCESSGAGTSAARRTSGGGTPQRVTLVCEGMTCLEAGARLRTATSTKRASGGVHTGEWDADCVVLVVAGGGDSLEACAELYSQIEAAQLTVPVLVACVPQPGADVHHVIAAATAFCTQQQLQPPVVAAASNHSSLPLGENIYATVAALCLSPLDGSPVLARRHQQAARLRRAVLYSLWALSGGAAAALAFKRFGAGR